MGVLHAYKHITRAIEHANICIMSRLVVVFSTHNRAPPLKPTSLPKHLFLHMRRSWEGIYVLYTYAARRQTAQTIQKLLSKPEAGSEDSVLRHITFCKY